MRVINLILHILTVIAMSPVLLFVGISTFMALGYLDGMELLIVPGVAAVFGFAFLGSTVGGFTQFASYRSTKPKVYVRREVVIHGLCALCCGFAAIYGIQDDDTGLIINLAGLGLSIVGIIVTLVGGMIVKRTKKIAQAPVNTQVAPSVSRPRFCPECGKATGTAGDYCGSCGSRLVR